MKNRIISLFLLLVFIAPGVFADYKITQQTSMQEGMTSESTVWAKGVRRRTESRMIFADAEQQAVMERMMPRTAGISQCDLKRDITLNDQKKMYFIDYYDWSTLTPEQKKGRVAQKITVKGTMTMSAVVTDSGKKQTMFGLPARWLKFVQSMDSSADSCDGKKSTRIEQEGWFVNLTLTAQTCNFPTQYAPPSGGCRPKMIVKSSQDPGFFLEGTTKMFDDGKLMMTSNLKTTALSKATLDQALFEIPTGYIEAETLAELTKSSGGFGDIMSGMGGQPGTKPTAPGSATPTAKPAKGVAVGFITGNASKVNQMELRSYIAQKVSAAGFNSWPMNSESELANGSIANVIGVEIKKVKESGASKIGGIFGKVTGDSSAAKIGDSEAEVIVTVYGKDGKTVIASMNAAQKVKGKADDAVKAAIEQVLSSLLANIK